MQFKERKILVLVRSKPYGKIANFEGWRAAVGMYGMDHQPTLLFMGDGVYSLMKAADDKPIRMFKSTYEGFGGRKCASKIFWKREALRARSSSRKWMCLTLQVLARC